MRAFVVGVAVILAASGAGWAAGDVERGQASFLEHCATCHGVDADGGGPMASVLSVPPADLTQLGKGGAFPTAQIVRRVDGRTEVLAHGGPMPLFGLLLEGPSAVIAAPDGTEIVTSEALAQIVAWLATVQK